MKLLKSFKIIEQLQLWDSSIGQYIQFKLWPKQIEFLNLILTSLKVIILKKRQTGISQLTGADSLVQCMFRENFTVLILSITGGDAVEYLKRIRDMYRLYNGPIKKVNPCVKGEDAGDEMVFASGSRLISLSAQKGRGRTGDRIIIDEAAFINSKLSHIELTEVLKAIEAVIEKAGGQIILVSTANGSNKFKEMFNDAMKKRNNYSSFFFSCWDDPTFTGEKRQGIIDDYGEDHTNQEHPRTHQEAFLSSGSPRFDKKALEYYTPLIVKPLLIGNITENGVEKTEQGDIQFFKKKKNRGQYIIFADVAEGLEHGDRSIAKVFDIETQELTAEWAGLIEHGEFGSVLYYMAIHYNNAHVAPEANNHGHASIIQLKNVHNYPEMLIFESNFVREKPDDDFKNPEKRFGWLTTSKTKKIIIDNLAQMLIKHLVPYLSFEDIEELKTYIKDKDGKTNAERGYFDDRVMCSAIAYYLLQFYELVLYLDWQKCTNCQYYNEDTQTCRETQRKLKDNDICVLYQEDELEFDEKEFAKLGGKL